MGCRSYQRDLAEAPGLSNVPSLDNVGIERRAVAARYSVRRGKRLIPVDVYWRVNCTGGMHNGWAKTNRALYQEQTENNYYECSRHPFTNTPSANSSQL